MSTNQDKVFFVESGNGDNTGSDLINRRSRRMWIAIINQAFIDALTNSRKLRARKVRRDAIKWLLEDTYDFQLVCELAGYDKNKVREQALTILVESPQRREIVINVLASMAKECRMERYTEHYVC